jgi:hypothetical protein
MSESATNFDAGVAPTVSFLKLDIDGADQAKFRIPRNLDSSKALDNLWRPQLHVTGVIIWGVPCFHTC